MLYPSPLTFVSWNLPLQDGDEASTLARNGVAWEALTLEEEARRASFAILYARQEARDGVIKLKHVQITTPVVSPPFISAHCNVPVTSDQGSHANFDGELLFIENEGGDISTSSEHLWAPEVGYNSSSFPYLQSKDGKGSKGSQRKRGQGQKQRPQRGGPSRNYDNELHEP